MIPIPPHKQTRLNAICPYFTRFPLSFPLSMLAEAAPEDCVLDPCCGGGTTLFAARLLGLAAVGVDCNPVAVAIARSKSVHVPPDAVEMRARDILASQPARASVPTERFWQLCFAPQVLRRLCRFREHFSRAAMDDTDAMLLGILLGLLHGPSGPAELTYFSNSMPASFSPPQEELRRYWQKHSPAPDEQDMVALIAQRARFLLEEQPKALSGKVVRGDGREGDLMVDGQPFDWVITSPPYYGLNSYVDDQWLRHWFMGNPDLAGAMLDQTGLGAYTEDLARLWRTCARLCRPGAMLAIRFGSVPARQHICPRTTLSTSLTRADAGWQIVRLEAVPPPVIRNQHPLPFPPPSDYPVDEFVLWARLRP